MQSATVKYTARPATETDLAAVVRYAARQKMKVSIRGVGHSAGGQSFCDNSLMIDMRDMNRIVDLDASRKLVRVQSGACWHVLTEALEPLHLAITTKQEFDSFTVGGSLAANVHGKSVDYGPLIEGIESFRLLKADGEIVSVSRTENSPLLPLVIGGFGLFGTVVDITFRLVDDRPVEKSEVVLMNREPLCASYVERVGYDPKNTPLCYGFLDALCTRGFYVTYRYVKAPGSYALAELKREETSPLLFDLLVCLQRWVPDLRRRSFWQLWSHSAKPEITLRSRRLLLWDTPPKAFQNMLLQKYFVPVEHFATFAGRVGSIFAKYGDDLPLLTHHFRFVPGNDEAVLSYAPRDAVCLIPCYLARKGSGVWQEHLQQATNELLTAALELGGSFYLAFDILASREYFKKAYPRWEEFFERKQHYDPKGLWSSRLYEKYVT